MSKPQIQNNSIAYFSMEVGINNDIHTYAGGLGILAGDTLKSAADLGLNMVGVTLISKLGYTKQRLNEEGQESLDDPWDYANILTKMHEKVIINLYGRDITVGVWKYELVGCSGHIVPIYFLDADQEQNSKEDRRITDHLYSGISYTEKILQQSVLGIGGFEILNKLGYPLFENYHLNESHAAFLALSLKKKLGSWNKTKNHLCFTTHTPLSTAHQKLQKTEVQAMLPQDMYDLIPDNIWIEDSINLTTLSIMSAKYTNGVAKKHMEVTKEMYPQFEIEYVTNGIHTNTWTSEPMKALFDKYLGDWVTKPSNLRLAYKIPISEIQSAHRQAKLKLFEFIENKNSIKLDPEILTLGFARRAVVYKRADLIFSDVERLKEIANKNGGIQIIFAGKAHPGDQEGYNLIKRILEISKSIDNSIKVVWLENYNINIGSMITSGVDVWLNTPLPPLEASGTSGMKAALNAIPNLSILDGWWLEGWIEDVTGWSIGGLAQSMAQSNAMDIEDIYDKLEHKIFPTYADKEKWFTIGRNNIVINADHFNTDRMLFEYLTRAYSKQLV